jgi:hypothetical protein
MAILSFNFTGWCRADIAKVFDVSIGKEIDVSQMPAQELADKLNKGVYSINFADTYAEAVKVENEICDFTSTEDDDEVEDAKAMYPLNKGE